MNVWGCRYARGWLCVLVVWGGMLLPYGIALYAYGASPQKQAIDIDSRLELLVDEYLIDKMIGGAELVLHRPMPREVALVFDQPWEGNTSGYPTVIRDGGLYRMYYSGRRMIYDEKGLRKAQGEVVCYAESEDGIHWTKPQLGLYEWRGLKETNIIWVGVGSHNFIPFLDQNPDCKPDAKFKAVGGTIKTGLHAFRSADGIHWSKLSEDPIFTDGTFDSANTAFWDPVRKRYALYFRLFSSGRLGEGIRLVSVTHSDDFLHWTEATPLVYPGSPTQQLYTNGILPYFRAPHILMGFPTRYVARDLTEHGKQLDPVELRSKLAQALLRVGTDLTEGLFMTSRDGRTFRRWDEAFIRPGPQHEGRWIYGDNFQSYGLFETKSAIEGGPREISFFVSEGAWREGEKRIRRYTIRLDGFVSANAPFSGGEIITKPLLFTGKKLVMNYATSAAGSVRVEIQDVDGKPLPGFSLDECPEHYGDKVDQTVAWSGGTDVSKLAGRPVRLRFVLKDADLYSFQFVK